MELTEGRIPDLDLVSRAATAEEEARRKAEAAASRKTIGQSVSDYITSRTDLSHKSISVHRKAEARLASLAPKFVDEITDSDVQDWIHEMEARPLKESTIRKYVETLQGALDDERLHPNPARYKRLRFSTEDGATEGDEDGGAESEVEPPSFAEYVALYNAIVPGYRLALDVIEAAGIRITEAVSLTVADINARDCQLRVAKQRTKGRRGRRRSRFVDMPPALMALVQEHVDERQLLPKDAVLGITDQGLRQAMARACRKAGIPLYSPHDLRHRFASVRAMAKWPMPVIAACLGHRKPSITFDTYAHVLTEEPDWLINQLREQQERGASVVSSRYPKGAQNEKGPA